MRCIATLALALGWLLSGCGKATTPTISTPAAAPGLFTDLAAQAGIRFRQRNGQRGRHYLLETTGSGCAFFDYDADGRPDLLFVQSGDFPWDGRPQRSVEPQNRLYRNRGDGTFTDVTAGSGLEDTGYSQGVAIGDMDGDGWDDVFITGFGGNHLFRNVRGTGRFQDVTARAGLADTAAGPRWCSSAAFGDFNNDGRLDLYVCRYAKWTPKLDKLCRNPQGRPSYCSPELYDGDEHALYRNDGNGVFTDVSRASGIAGAAGHGLGLAWLDANGDGWEDLFVANDLSPFFLWRNNRDGTFTNIGEAAGVAYSDMGQLLSGMGVAARDFSGDGREDLFVTNFSGQMNALFRNEGEEVFTNVTIPSGIGPASFTHLGFGCEALDFDRDGWPDLLVGNGHVNEDVAAYSEGIEFAQAKSLLRNNGNGTFTDVREALGSLATPRVTRGLATADYDGDGHLDVATVNQNGDAELLRYTGPDNGHWISLRTRGTRSNPNGYHARMTVRAGGRSQTAEVRSGSSYQSHSDSAVYFGLGAAEQVEELRIVWSGSKTVTVARSLAADRAYVVREGEAVRVDPTGAAHGVMP